MRRRRGPPLLARGGPGGPGTDGSCPHLRADRAPPRSRPTPPCHQAVPSAVPPDLPAARTGPVTGAPPTAPPVLRASPSILGEGPRVPTGGDGGRNRSPAGTTGTCSVMVPAVPPRTVCLSHKSWGPLWPCSDGVLRIGPHPPSAVLVTTDRGGTQPPAQKHLGLPGSLGRERGPVTPRFGTPGSGPREDVLGGPVRGHLSWPPWDPVWSSAGPCVCCRPRPGPESHWLCGHTRVPRSTPESRGGLEGP